MKASGRWVFTHKTIWRKPERKINLLLRSLEQIPNLGFVTLQDVPNYLNECHEMSQRILKMKLVLLHLKIDGR